MIAGAGLDVLDIDRMARAAARPDTDPTAGILTSAERARCAASPRAARRVALWFAAKEACLKALGTGLVGRMSWRDIEITEDGCGRLVVHLSGETARVAARQGIRRLHLAWAAPRTLALAWAIAEGDAGGDADSSQEAIDGG